MATTTELKDILTQSIDRMIGALEHVDESIEIYPAWTAKEVIAHLVGWDKVSSDSLSSFIQGGIPDKVALDGDDAFNNASVQTYAGLSFEETVQEWEKERQRLLEMLIALSDEQLDEKITYPWGGEDSIAKMLLFLSEHDTQHTNDIIRIIQS